jgi:hypothetical protein
MTKPPAGRFPSAWTAAALRVTPDRRVPGQALAQNPKNTCSEAQFQKKAEFADH